VAYHDREGEDVTLRFIKYPINPWRDEKQICLNGHIITSRYHSKPHERKDYCDRCGKKTITKCPKCRESILGDMYSPYYLYSAESEPPQNCEKCDKPFPWKKSKIHANATGEPLPWLENLFLRFHSITE
jgi:hypothetical protein